MKTKIDLIRAHYEPLVRSGAAHHEMLDWGSRDAQLTRFRVLAECMREHGLFRGHSPALLDVGCGITDLNTFFDSEGLPVDYTGVDITPAILDRARTEFPDRKIIQADVFQASPFNPREFDVVFCSGTLNLRLGNNEQFAARALEAMLKLADKLLVVNFLHERTRHQYQQCYYYSPEKILNTAVRLAPAGVEIRLIDTYMENDFTLEVKL